MNPTGLHVRERDYRARLEQHGITCSMGRRGNYYDNAVKPTFCWTC
jgi:transposase InsO family protein